MDITGEYRIAADRDRVWEALNDPEMLKKCIPGCESLERVSDTELKARVTAAIGPVRSTFNTRLTIENPNPPSSYTLVGNSKAGAAGFGKGHADVSLEELDGATRLRYSAAFKVGGKLAQVGSRLVLGATKKTADEFFGNLSRELDPAAERVGGALETPPSRAVSRLLGMAAAVAGVLLLAWLLLR
jgi:carbon monoxide dehydrogenase subunit G